MFHDIQHVIYGFTLDTINAVGKGEMCWLDKMRLTHTLLSIHFLFIYYSGNEAFYMLRLVAKFYGVFDISIHNRRTDDKCSCRFHLKHIPKNVQI